MELLKLNGHIHKIFMLISSIFHKQHFNAKTQSGISRKE